MDFIIVCATLRDVDIEDIGVKVPKGKSVTIKSADMARTEDLWSLLRQGLLFQVYSHIKSPVKSTPPPPLPMEDPTLEKKLDEVLEQMKAKPNNALRKLEVVDLRESDLAEETSDKELLGEGGAKLPVEDPLVEMDRKSRRSVRGKGKR